MIWSIILRFIANVQKMNSNFYLCFCESFYITDAFNGISYTERIAFKYPIKLMHFRVPVLYKCNIDSYGEHHLVQIPIRINVFHQIEWPNPNHQKNTTIYIYSILKDHFINITKILKQYLLDIRLVTCFNLICKQFTLSVQIKIYRKNSEF